MKHIPNLFTLLNLLLGCLAIVNIVQTGLTIMNDDAGMQLVEIPETMYWASVYIAAAALVDFFDGFIARLFRATSNMGKQLDSLADVVSFGVAPGMIVYQFLRLSYAQQENGLNVSALWLLPAFIIPCAGAYRLARFNTDTAQSLGFKGLPIPAAGLFIAAFPLIYWQTNTLWIIELLRNKWFWYAVIVFVSYLMVSTLPMLALKFKLVNFIQFLPFVIVLMVGLLSAFLLQWMAVPVAVITYVFVSLLFKKQ